MDCHFSVRCGDDFFRPLCGEWAADDTSMVLSNVTCPKCLRLASAEGPMKYNSQTCITAKELRDAGFPLPAVIANDQWVPRSSMKIHSDGARFSNGEFGEEFASFSMDLHVTFTEPFQR